MMNQNPTAVIPDGYTTVTPWIAVKGVADFYDFLAAAFDAVEIARVANADGTIGHAEARIGDAVVMSFDIGQDWPEYPALLRLYVADADETVRRAVAAGAVVVTEPTALFWGDKVGRVRDPWGNIWWIQQRMEAPTVSEMDARMHDPEWSRAMDYVQTSAAEELKRVR